MHWRGGGKDGQRRGAPSRSLGAHELGWRKTRRGAWTRGSVGGRPLTAVHLDAAWSEHRLGVKLGATMRREPQPDETLGEKLGVMIRRELEPQSYSNAGQDGRRNNRRAGFRSNHSGADGCALGGGRRRGVPQECSTSRPTRDAYGQRTRSSEL